MSAQDKTEQHPLMTPSADASPTSAGIFYGWWIVVASGIGLALHYGPIIVTTFGVFVKPLSHQFGWSRGQLSIAFSLSTLGLAVTAPFVGRLADYFGARRVILPATLLFGLGFLSLSLLSNHIWHFYAIFILLGLVGVGTTPVTYSKVITRWFDRKRGLALGLAVAVNSMSSMVMPFFAQTLITRVGWRQAYLFIGLIVIGIALPVVGLLLKESPEAVGLRPDGETIDDARIARPREVRTLVFEVRRTAAFWLIAAALFLISVSYHGSFIHLVPMLTDRGMSSERAALAASLVGAGALMARLIAGYLLDIFLASSVAVWFFCGSTLGLALLWSGAPGDFAFVASFLIGLGVGAEFDIVPYMVSRYFGLAVFAETYGYLMAIFSLGAVAGPPLMGIGFDATGSYRLILGMFAIATLTAAGLVTRLGPYPEPDFALAPA
jgi:MFS family permease